MPRGLKEKRLPPFWHPCFDHSEGIFLFVLCRRSFGSVRFKGRSSLLLPKVVCFGPFERSKPLGVLFALFVPFLSKVICFGPFEGLSPLAFVLGLLCLLCRRFFGSYLLEGRSPLTFILHLLCL